MEVCNGWSRAGINRGVFRRTPLLEALGAAEAQFVTFMVSLKHGQAVVLVTILFFHYSLLYRLPFAFVCSATRWPKPLDSLLEPSA